MEMFSAVLLGLFLGVAAVVLLGLFLGVAAVLVIASIACRLDREEDE